MKKGKCSECGAEVNVVRGAYCFEESALKNVVLLGVEMARCTECGNEDVSLPRVNKLMRALALAVINKPYRLNGDEVRFLRKFLGMTGAEFSRLIHVDNTTLSKWENRETAIGPQSDLLVRSVALALGEGLQAHTADSVRRFERVTKPPRSTLRLQLDSETLEYQYT